MYVFMNEGQCQATIRSMSCQHFFSLKQQVWLLLWYYRQKSIRLPIILSFSFYKNSVCRYYLEKWTCHGKNAIVSRTHVFCLGQPFILECLEMERESVTFPRPGYYAHLKNSFGENVISILYCSKNQSTSDFFTINLFTLPLHNNQKYNTL